MFKLMAKKNNRQVCDEKKDFVELKGKIKKVSNLKICKNAGVNFLQFCFIIYIQNNLFYQSHSNELYYRNMMDIFFISAIIHAIFAVRILNIGNGFKTICLVAFVIFIIINICCFAIFGADTWVKLVISRQSIPLILMMFHILSFVVQINVTKYAIQCKMAELNEDAEHYNQLMIRASTHADFMNNLECYLRAAPQQVVQVAVFFYNHGDFSKISVLQQGSILFALGLMPWSNTAFQGSYYRMLYKEVSIKTKVIYYCGVFSLMVARISSIGEAMAFWPIETSAVILIHWLTAVVWFWRTTKPTEFFNNNQFWHVFLSIVFGWVYLFTPMNLIEEPTYRQYFWFYVILFIQNTAASVVWFLSENEMALLNKIAVVCANGLAFVLGLVFIIWYYKKYHPSKLAPDEDCENEECENEDCENEDCENEDLKIVPVVTNDAQVHCADLCS